MTMNPDPMQLDQLIENIGGLAAQINALKREVAGENKIRAQENAKRDRRIRLSRILIALVLVVAAAALWVGREAQATADDIIAARKDGRSAVCNEVAALVDASLAASPSTNPDAQANIDKFAADLQARSGPLGCQFHFVVPTPGG